MATYTKRGNSYRLRASCGYTPEGKQIMKSKTWTPAPQHDAEADREGAKPANGSL